MQTYPSVLGYGKHNLEHCICGERSGMLQPPPLFPIPQQGSTISPSHVVPWFDQLSFTLFKCLAFTPESGASA